MKMKLTREQQRKILDGVAEFVRDLSVTEFCETLGTDKYSVGAVKDLMEDVASRVVSYFDNTCKGTFPDQEVSETRREETQPYCQRSV